MRCSRARKSISDYVDNNLKAVQRLSLEEHLHKCPDCKQLLKDFQGIVTSAKELEALSPSDRVWIDIKSKLKTEQQKVLVPQVRRREWFRFLFSPPKLRYALSAAFMVVVILGAAYFGLQFWKGKRVLEGNNLQRYTMAKLEKAEHHYQLAIKALVEAVSAQEGSFDPKVAEVFRVNLHIIDASIKACKHAVLNEPDNIEARNYLLTVYREKVDFLSEMMEISKRSSRNGRLEKTL